MINQPASPSYTQQHPVYTAANLYANTIPLTAAAGSALFTPGNRMDKTSAGASSFGYWLGFQQMDRMYQKGLHRFYEKHPKVADTVNQNPILLGFPIILLGLVPDIMAGTLLESGVRMGFNHPKVNSAIHKALHSDSGNHVADSLRPIEKKLNRPIVLAALGIAGTVFMAYLLIRAFLDAKHFGHDYREARKEHPYKDLPPGDLKAALMNPNTNQATLASSNN